jgi:UDP-glucose 4-epimerase
MRRVKLEARVNTPKSEVRFNENVVATSNLLEAMRRRGVRETAFASSSSVYSEPEEIPVDEDAPARLVSVYGARLKVKRRHGGRLRILSSVYSEPGAY